MHSNWLVIVMWLWASNQSDIIQQSIPRYTTLIFVCLWHQLQVFMVDTQCCFVETKDIVGKEASSSFDRFVSYLFLEEKMKRWFVRKQLLPFPEFNLGQVILFTLMWVETTLYPSTFPGKGVWGRFYKLYSSVPTYVTMKS